MFFVFFGVVFLYANVHGVSKNDGNISRVEATSKNEVKSLH